MVKKTEAAVALSDSKEEPPQTLVKLKQNTLHLLAALASHLETGSNIQVAGKQHEQNLMLSTALQQATVFIVL